MKTSSALPLFSAHAPVTPSRDAEEELPEFIPVDAEFADEPCPQAAAATADGCESTWTDALRTMDELVLSWQEEEARQADEASLRRAETKFQCVPTSRPAA